MHEKNQLLLSVHSYNALNAHDAAFTKAALASFDPNIEFERELGYWDDVAEYHYQYAEADLNPCRSITPQVSS